MIPGKIIIGIAVIVLQIQLLLLYPTDKTLYNYASIETCINNVANEAGGECNDFVFPEYIIPGQQITLINRFYIEYKIFPCFPVCIYTDFSMDILTPPPNETV